MKNLNISTYGVEEMSKQKMQTTDGGGPVLVAIGWCLIGLLVGELNDRNGAADFEQGAADARKWLGKE